MIEKAENPPAFPMEKGSPLVTAAQGMSLRDYFAGQALAGFCADPNNSGDHDLHAKCSYERADAMLKARAK